jgi:hypothetical protein
MTSGALVLGRAHNDYDKRYASWLGSVARHFHGDAR